MNDNKKKLYELKMINNIKYRILCIMSTIFDIYNRKYDDTILSKELKFMSTGKTIPGGNTLRFNAFHLLEMKTGAVLDSEKYGFDGVVVKAKCVKNKLFPPNIEIELVGDFIRGFSNFWTNWHFLTKHGRVKSAGGWVYFSQTPTVKFRVKEAPKRYNEEIEFKKMFDDAIKEALKTELIDKYNPDL